MDAASTSITTLPGNLDAVNSSLFQECDDPLHSPVRPSSLAVAKRRIAKTGAFGSAVRRSSRLSSLPPQPSTECLGTPDLDESSDNGSENVDNVVFQFSREETPENDILPPDEPSTVLAERIIRAHDNPSPPPQDLVHSGVNYMPGNDGQFPLSGALAPPSTFRPINLLERLNQLSHHSFDPPPNLVLDRPGISEPGITSPCGFFSLQSCSSSLASVSFKGVPHEVLESTDSIPSSSTQYRVDDLSLPSVHHTHEPANPVHHVRVDPSQPAAGPHGRSIPTTSFLDSDIHASPTPVIGSSFDPEIHFASDDYFEGTLPRSRRQSLCESSPLAPNVKTLSSFPSREITEVSPTTKTTDPGGEGNDDEILPIDNNGLPASREEQESMFRATGSKRVDEHSYQRVNSLSPHSTNVVAGPCFPSESISHIEQTILPVDPIFVQHTPATPFRTHRPVTYPDFSRSTVQRPAIAPTPVRVNNSHHRLTSPTKMTFGASDICRTPAQRVPIETALAHGTPSLQRTVQLSTGSDHSQLGRLLTIRAPVFTRPPPDDPSRSPAKRVPVMGLLASPTRGDQASSSPRQLSLRARSASMEPRPLRPIHARSRSVEPRTTVLKPDKFGRVNDTVFPMVTMLSRSSTKLPFPLIPGQKTSSDLPPTIPEEHASAEKTGNTEIDATLSRQGNTISQLRQPYANSRIPRIGNKPYARPPPKSGKATVGVTTTDTSRAPKASSFQIVCKNNGLGSNDTGTSSTQPASNQHLMGSLKRKRGTEVTAPYPVMVRQVVPGILSGKYAPKPTKISPRIQPSSPPKVPQPLKFRKVVDGMLSTRYAPAKANLTRTEPLDPTSATLSPLSELSSSSDEGPSDQKEVPVVQSPTRPKGEVSHTSQTGNDAIVSEPSTHKRPSLGRDVDDDKFSSPPRRTSRTRKPAQQQYILDVFSSNASTRPPPARRKPQSRVDSDGFMGMSATALKALTTSNTTKNQQTVAVLATEVVRKEGLRPESPTVKARTILQKRKDERDVRRRERALRKVRMNEEGLVTSDTEKRIEVGDQVSPSTAGTHEGDDCAVPPKHCRGPGDEEDYETPERPERGIEPLRLEGVDAKARPAKQVKWHRGLSTTVYLDEVDPRSKLLSKGVGAVRGCLAAASKNLPLDPLGNFVDIDNQPPQKLVTEQIIVKKYLYDNDIEPEPIPLKVTRSKSKKSKS